jgi:hypothetical protein
LELREQLIRARGVFTEDRPEEVEVVAQALSRDARGVQIGEVPALERGFEGFEEGAQSAVEQARHRLGQRLGLFHAASSVS